MCDAVIDTEFMFEMGCCWNDFSFTSSNYKQTKCATHTFRCFPLIPVADVGVIVTDGVMERLLPVRDWFIPLRFGEPPAVKTAPPGNDDRVGSMGIAPCVERLIEIDGVRFFKWAGGAIAGKVVGVKVREPLVITDVGRGGMDCVTMMFSLSSCCDCLIFFKRTNLVSSFRNSSLNLRRFRSRSHISAADNSCRMSNFSIRNL